MITRYRPCRCGAEPLNEDHLARAEYDSMCADRVAEVRLLMAIRARGEDRVIVPQAEPGWRDGITGRMLDQTGRLLETVVPTAELPAPGPAMLPRSGRVA